MTQRVQIYCDNPTHPRRRVKIVLFVHDDELTNDWRWEDFTKDAILFLDGETPLSGAAEYLHVLRQSVRPVLAGEADAPEPRIRYELACPRCQLRLRLTIENLRPILDQVAAAGVSEIQLKALISILS